MNMTSNNSMIIKIDRELEELIPDFLERRRKDLAVFKLALAQKDLETLRTMAHQMKGFGGGYGFDHLTTLGKAMEEAAKVGDLVAYNKGLDELEAYLAMVVVEYV